MILIVEDDKHTCETLSHVLEELGFKCLCAESVHDAIEKANRIKPTVILADLLLGDGDAVPLVRYCQAKMPETKIILMSATARRTLESTALQLGIDNYLPKPFEIESLENALHRVM